MQNDYPNVKFTYMTGRLDGTGVEGDPRRNGELIGSFCRTHGRTLFDFADIRSYDPDGNHFLDKDGNDNCDCIDPFTSQTRHWAAEWCAARTTVLCISCNS